MSKSTWTLADHLCRACGGRILKCASGAGPTPGGNPLWKCADCGRSASGMGPEVLCWCGQAHRFNRDHAYVCQPFSVLETRPELLDAFRACGCDPARGGEVGIMLKRNRRMR
jgi:hypothetical protein